MTGGSRLSPGRRLKQLDYSGNLTGARQNDVHVAVGRQRIILGDARFIGNLGWRQHEQTFDAVSITDAPLPDTVLTYAYVAGVNRVFGPHSPVGRFTGDTHFFNAVYSGFAPLLPGRSSQSSIRQAS